MTGAAVARSTIIVPGNAEGEVLDCRVPISFWGGVDPESGRIIDVHHPCHGETVSGRILMMPSSRGSCSGSGVLLELALNGRAPAALVFSEAEETLTLGALVAAKLFGLPVPVFRLRKADYAILLEKVSARFSGNVLQADGEELDLYTPPSDALNLSDSDRARLAGKEGDAQKIATEILCLMATALGADGLIDVEKGHIDGCILAHPANLVFAEKMQELGARTTIPTTINAISVDRANWRGQGVEPGFGARASRLADAYQAMGAEPTFTCAPYFLDDVPAEGEKIGWSESNAVIYANSVLGARTAKHPDYLDLFIAMTGRAPSSAIYTDAGRRPGIVLEVTPPSQSPDDSFWPLLGWTVGRISPDRIPLVTGLQHLRPTPDDLKALCAAFGTTSGAPMLHVAGHTPEASVPWAPDAIRKDLTLGDLAQAWDDLNRAPDRIDLVAIGSPHASLGECRRIAELLAGRRCEHAQMIVTLGRSILQQAALDGTLARLRTAGVRVVPDLCWCSITEPVFPANAHSIMTNSGKYAHYAHGLSGRHARLASLYDCVEAAVTGKIPEGQPAWLVDRQRPSPNSQSMNSSG